MFTMGYCANSIDSDFTIPPANIAAALEAVRAAFETTGTATLTEVIEENTCFDGCEEDAATGFTLGCHHDKWWDSTEQMLAVLAPFAVEGSSVRMLGEDDCLFGFRVLDGQLRTESGRFMWSLDGETAAHVPVRAGGVLAPMTVERDLVGYAAWWAASDTAEIEELLDGLTGDTWEAEHTLAAVMGCVFQNDPGSSPTRDWLTVTGLAHGVTVAYLGLDLDPSYDGQGVLDGLTVVLNLTAVSAEAAEQQNLSVSVYAQVRDVLPAGGGAPCEVLGDIIDTALALVNCDIAASDRFIVGARDVPSAA